MEENNKSIDLISLEDFPITKNGIKALKNHIFEKLDRRVFEFRTMNELVFEVLKMIDKSHDILPDPNNIDQGMETILRYFQIEESEEHIMASILGGRDYKMSGQKYFNFYFYILGLRQVPYIGLMEVKPKVEEHLNSINSLIQLYEESNEIKHFKRENQASKISSLPLLHFYWRCMEERQKILEYYFNGMYDWAIRLSGHFMDKTSVTFAITQMAYKPYDYQYNLLGPNYNYWDIDCSSHRLRTFEAIQPFEAVKYAELYKRDKQEFYKEIFKLRDKGEVLSNVKKMIESLLHEDRKFIFDEMLKHFEKKEWLAFYAIALPQVEGLFSEMIESESLNRKTRSLSTKARAMRDSSYIDTRALDYFEYKLPDQRNRFAHGGLLDKKDIELLAYDLITDLECLLYQFSELENSFVKATRIVTQGTSSKIDGLDSLMEFIRTIFSLTDPQEKLLLNKIRKINDEIILPKEQHFKWLFSKYATKYDSGKIELNDELKKMGFNEIDRIDNIVKQLGSEVITILSKKFFDLTIETSFFTLEFLELIRKYSNKYFDGNFFREELIEYGKKEKKAMKNIKGINDYNLKD